MTSSCDATIRESLTNIKPTAIQKQFQQNDSPNILFVSILWIDLISNSYFIIIITIIIIIIVVVVVVVVVAEEWMPHFAFYSIIG